MTLGETVRRKQRKWRQFAGRYRWRWGREGKLDAWSRWRIKQWGSCDMMGFPYIPPCLSEKPTQRPAVTATRSNTACSSCAGTRAEGHTSFVSAHRGVIVAGHLWTNKICKIRDGSTNTWGVKRCRRDNLFLCVFVKDQQHVNPDVTGDCRHERVVSQLGSAGLSDVTEKPTHTRFHHFWGQFTRSWAMLT